ncbi:unnamed protein product [Didymodactylos carnosus]|uniref:F-box domain-containing protein n=1 Tax=Didymodactylos carnosus TaxID=1234261 RepID=A0A814YPH1_9BILA|nr:unnamed protein product [Didymodactylos carnosus]CAF1476171.1 unnamed protein product [Didymodactylos carnosus]CAF3994238.1 unnamed protein product [Didymodactylos carnosus]CAF4267250.1 unnamed protein product [Didymodactylos carnosus]
MAVIDKLPTEILEKIFLRLAVQPSLQLIDLSVVCQKWNSIIKDAHFLDKFFHHRLVSYSPLQFRHGAPYSPPFHSTEKYLIPNCLRLSDAIFLESEANDMDYYIHDITSLPLSFTISFWFSLPNKKDAFGVLAKSPTSNKCLCLFYNQGWHLWTVAKRYAFKNDDVYQPKVQGWNHIAVSLIHNGNIFFYINGKQYQFDDEWSFEGFQGATEDNILVKYWSDLAHDVLCLCDIRLIPGCLTRMEIETAAKQPPVPLDMIKVGTYWKNKMKEEDRQ